MNALLVNQIFSYLILVLNAIAAGQLLWFAINLKMSKTIQFLAFILGVLYVVSLGGLYKAPAFMTQLLVYCLYINAIFGIYVFYAVIRNVAVSNKLIYVAFLVSSVASYIVITGIQEFGMRYMPTLLFFAICLYTGFGFVLYQIKAGKDQKMQKRISYIALSLTFSLFSLNAFHNYLLVRDTAYTDTSSGWETETTETTETTK